MLQNLDNNKKVKKEIKMFEETLSLIDNLDFKNKIQNKIDKLKTYVKSIDVAHDPNQFGIKPHNLQEIRYDLNKIRREIIKDLNLNNKLFK